MITVIVPPVLQEVRRIVNQQVSLFSGRDFTVDVEKGLHGYVDYLLSRSQEQLEIEAPVAETVSKKKKCDRSSIAPSQGL